MKDGKQITLEYLDKLAEDIWDIIKKENNYRYSDRRIYLDDLLISIDKVEAIIENDKI